MLASGLTWAGTPLAQVNPADVEARVMGISAIDSVKVTRRWPHDRDQRG